MGRVQNASVGRAQRCPPSVAKDPALILLARRMIATRRVLSRSLPAGIVADHGLDVLLVLFLADADDERRVEAELIAALAMPPEPARRWIAALIQAGLAMRADGTVTLTHDGSAAMAAAIGHVRDTMLAPMPVR